MLNYNKIPVDYMVDGVRRYIENGIPPGSFLLALFSNNLKDAFRRADEDNTHAMREWVSFVINEMPSNAQGSEENVEQWIEDGGLVGRETLMQRGAI